jgi:metal-responsive CopG/Arc/MetJ family transcriptional regulator
MKRLSVTIEPEVNKVLEDTAANKSKLINKLLRAYLIKKGKLQK